MEERPQPHAQRGAEPAAQPANTAVPSAMFSISPPEAFDFAKPQEWQKWIRRFECFRVASNLDKSSEANQCPAKNADCHNCGKRGHYGRVCKSEKTLSAVSEDSTVFLGIVDAGEEPWTVDVGVRHTKVAFKIDTGADVTVMPEQVYREIAQGSTRSLTPGKKALVGPGTPLTVVGVAREVLQCGDRSTTEDVYVLKHLKVALLSRPADIVVHLKSMFVRHGIPETVVTDNRPQFSGGDMSLCSRLWI
ncbi:hypothetical protein SKAU_G00424250 [Synaphobranchus kaupii]|uniref:CCHC-type domain-containing protein n=1 Tax=Synaphobranchus kaupii TaxID=118154 RepID=A0A9Q1E5J6_SYNKA|nr:hypothetical protein SKAU_G00424250 [Synaphobranchus kaupii]